MSKRSVIKKWLALTLGVIAVIAVICSQSVDNDFLSFKLEKDVKTEAPTEDHHSDVLTISQDVVSSFVQVTLSNGLQFISNISHNADEIKKVQVIQKIDFNSYFKALFRLIISPNAP